MKLVLVKKLLYILLIPFFQLLALINWSGSKRQEALLVFYTGKMGDLVCLTPIFRALKESHPGQQLFLIARFPFTNILKNNPHIDQVVTYFSDRDLSSFSWLVGCWRKINNFKVSKYFNFTAAFEANVFGMWIRSEQRFLVTFNDGNFSTAKDNWSQRFFLPFYKYQEFRYDQLIKNFYLNFLKANNIKGSSTKNELFFGGSLPGADKLKNKIGSGKKIIGISVSSGKDYKCWPTGHWIKLLRILTEKKGDVEIVFFGSEAERENIEKVSQTMNKPVYLVVGKPIPELSYYIRVCDLFVSVDTGLSYIADALKVPVINIMGPVDSAQQQPDNSYRILTKPGKYKPIIKTPLIVGLTKQDLDIIEAYYSSISPEEVYKAIDDFFTGN